MADPSGLHYGHHEYFQCPIGTLIVPIVQLRPTKEPVDQPDAVLRAAELMLEASKGVRDRRPPLSVQPEGATFRILDGNATYGAAMRAGWRDLPVRLASGPRPTRSLQNDFGPIRILAIDGGGIRGVIPAMVLAELEKLGRTPISQLFDLIAGTSTGGILALGLTLPSSDGRPAHSAADLVGLYEREGQRIFDGGFAHRVRSGWSLLRQKYPSSGLEDVLQEYFGEMPISSALTDVIVPAYDIEQRSRYWFKARKARVDPSDDVAMRDAARATAAAPTYFQPARVRRELRYRTLVDGGVYANNPSMAAYVEACDKYGTRDVILLSLGTGELTRPVRYSEARHWGLARWARPILDVVFDGVSDETHHSLRKVVGTGRYTRLQSRLDEASDSMDNAHAENIHRLKVQAEHLVFDHHEHLADLAGRLTRRLSDA